MSDIQDVIREKITWFWNLALPQAHKRDLSLGEPLVPALGNRVKVIVGVRRCGKTWRMFQEVARLEAEGVRRKDILYFNFDDERLRPYERTLPSLVMECFYRLNPEGRTGAYVFFDEIQDVPDWGVFMRRMVDTEAITSYVTGSSSKMLSQDVATEFRGRATSYELTPYSFPEYARCHGKEIPADLEAVHEQERLDLERLFEAYLVEGGYPEAQDLDPMSAVNMLQDIAINVVAADVVERYNLAQARTARIVSAHCLASSARKLSLTKLHNRLKSAGHGIGWEKLEALVGYLEDANLLYRVPEYSTSLSDNSRKAQKVYANDQSLMLAMSPSTSIDRGLALETAVYLELRRRQSTARRQQVMTWSVPWGSTTLEVDFVKGDRLFDSVQQLVQVSESLAERHTRRRELRALEAAMAEAAVSEAVVVTLHEREQVEVDAGTIRVVPAWQWFAGGEA